MRRFWDARAREDALYFVDSRVPYGAADAERFWIEGVADLDRLLGAVEARVDPSARLVEIGCGVGRLTRALASRAEEVVAIDVSAEMLARGPYSSGDCAAPLGKFFTRRAARHLP